MAILPFNRPAAPFLDGGVDGLLACSFCGTAHEVEVYENAVDGDEGADYHVICMNCGVEGPPGHTRLDAAVAWNTRPVVRS